MQRVRHSIISLRFLALLAGSILTGILLSSCELFAPTVKGTVNDSVEVNEAVGEAESEMMLLNILRAMRKQPLVFTDYAQFSEGLPNSSLKINLAQPSTGDTIGPGFNSSTRSFTSTPLDQNQAFIRNIMAPITPDTVMYYNDKGWPTSLLLHLFVSKIVVHSKPDGSDIVASYSNYPYVLATFHSFSTLANELGGCEVSLPDTSDATGAPLPSYIKTKRALVFAPPSVTAGPAAAACALAMNQLTAGGKWFELIYRSPLDSVRYLGDVVREQLYSDNSQKTGVSAQNIGVVTYSDACFYQQNGSTMPCQTYCNALFVLQTDPPRGAGRTDPACAFYTNTIGDSGTKSEGEELGSWSVHYQGPTYYLPLHYLDHSETLHVLSILQLLIGYQAGTETSAPVKASADKPKQSTDPTTPPQGSAPKPAPVPAHTKPAKKPPRSY